MPSRFGTRTSCHCTRMNPACCGLETGRAVVSRWNPCSWELGGHRPEWLGSKLVTTFADAPKNKVWIGSLAAA